MGGLGHNEVKSKMVAIRVICARIYRNIENMGKGITHNSRAEKVKQKAFRLWHRLMPALLH